MSIHAIVVYSPAGQRVLAVEIKSGAENAPDQLERSRDAFATSITTHGASFLLLAQRNGLFLWNANEAKTTKPAFAPVESLLRDYATSVADRPERLRKPELEMIIYSWLDDLVLEIRKPKPGSEADQLLVEAGVHAQILRGRVTSERQS